MKKIIPLILSILMITAIIAGCETAGTGDGESTPDGVQTTPGDSPTPSQTPDDSTPPPQGGGNGGDVTLDSDVETLMAQVFENLDDSLELPMFMNTPLSNGMEFGEHGLAYFIGTNDVPIVDGVASEAAIGAIPLSVCLVRVAPNTDVEAAMTLIQDNAPRDKWICVWADTVVVERIGDLVILIMNNEEERPGLTEAFKQAFLALI